MCTIYNAYYAVLVAKSFWDLRFFVAKSVLSQFTRIDVEKNWANNFVCGEKRTNMRYAINLNKITKRGMLWIEGLLILKQSMKGVEKSFKMKIESRIEN